MICWASNLENWISSDLRQLGISSRPLVSFHEITQYRQRAAPISVGASSGLPVRLGEFFLHPPVEARLCLPGPGVQLPFDMVCTGRVLLFSHIVVRISKQLLVFSLV